MAAGLVPVVRCQAQTSRLPLELKWVVEAADKIAAETAAAVSEAMTEFAVIPAMVEAVDKVAAETEQAVEAEYKVGAGQGQQGLTVPCL